MRPRFVGRQKALAALAKAWGDASDLGELAFVAVVGPPGSGKTRLLREFARTLKHKAPLARFLLGQAGGSGGAPQGRLGAHSLPYAPIVHLFMSRFGITTSDADEIARQKIIACISDVLPAAKVAEVSHLLAHLLRVDFPDSPIVLPLAESPQQLEARTFIAIKRFLGADADKGALVLCLDDLERAGAETINLLHYLAAGLQSSPVLLLCAARPSLYETHPTFGAGETPLVRVELGPLDDYESENLLRELLRPLDPVPRALVDHARKLGGMPRTLFELLRFLLEAEVIVRTGTKDAWTLDASRLGALALPEKHEDILLCRLKQMAPAERDLIEKAAACGEVFWLDAIVALTRVAAVERKDPDGPTLSEIALAGDKTRVSVAQTLARLVEREWIVDEPDGTIPGEREYRFAYPPIWEVVYAKIDHATKKNYHQLVAQWLELRPEGRGEESQEEVGRHLENAGEGNAAAARYRRAADAARHRFFNEKAIRLYAQALACLGDADRAARIHLWHDLGSVYELKGDFEAALGAFERMLRLTWMVSSRTKAAVAFNKMGRVFRRKGDLSLALEYLERGEELFEQAGDHRGIAGSLDDIGHVLWLLGRYDEAFDRITRALNLRGQSGDKRSIAHSLSNLGNLQKDRGKFLEAETCHKEALGLRRAISDRVGVISSLNNLAVLAFDRGDKEGARSGWEKALAESEEIGALPLQALALNNLGELALVEGKQEEARRRLEETVAIARELDDRRLISEATRNLGLLELEGGNAALADELAQRALSVAESSGLRDYVGRALLALGEVHAAILFDETSGEDLPRAESYFRRGVDLFRQVGNESELAKGLERFGRYKLERGDVNAGKNLLVEAHQLFSKLGMKAGDEVRKVIGEL